VVILNKHGCVGFRPSPRTRSLCASNSGSGVSSG
jgi:hypothetical protein